MGLPLRLLLPVLAVLSMLTTAAFAQTTWTASLPDFSNSVVKVRSVFSEVPPIGAMAFKVTLVNHHDTPLRVDFSSDCHNDEARLENTGCFLEAPPRATVTREWTVPITILLANWRSLRVEFSYPGGVQSYRFTSDSLERDVPFVGFSVALARHGIGRLQGEMNKRRVAPGSASYHSGGTFAALYEPEDLPSDWRALTGLSVLAITTPEWLSLSESARLAVRQYVLMGGRLDLYHSGSGVEGILKPFGLNPESLAPDEVATLSAGAGSVRLLPWDGEELKPDAVEYYMKGIPVRAKIVRALLKTPAFRGPPEEKVATLHDLLGSKDFAAWQVGVILLMFGIVVGPVNLFYLAGPGRRHRLFFTTPLISLGATALVLAVILLQDGVGGVGHRAALAHVRAEDNAVYLKQYQVSRAGVLLSGGFTLPQSAMISPLPVPPSRWARMREPGGGWRGGDALSRFIADVSGGYGGEFFQSRSEQGQLLEAVQPFRGRIEKRATPGPDGAPVLVSSLGCRLDALYYRDGKGQWWTAGPVENGAEAALRPLPPGEGPPADLVFTYTGIPLEAGRKRQEELEPGDFVAVTGDASGLMLPTLSSIDWKTNRAVLYGAVKEIP